MISEIRIIEEVSIILNMSEIGFQIGRANSELQVQFFDALAKGFNSYADGDKDGMQMLWMKNELSPEAKALISKLNVYVNGEKLNDNLFEICKKSPAPNFFANFAQWAEECSEKVSMVVYKQKFITMATFLRACENNANKIQEILYANH